MSDESSFQPPAIDDEDLRWASQLLGLPGEAFFGPSGTDARRDVLKSMERMDVAACPGSGKTTLLVAKLAILAKKWQHRTRGICVLSHTNAARHEIERRLANTAAGQRLLAYPHFIGTIHAFVNEFLAIPWLRSCGYAIRMIDTAASLERRWRSLSYATRSGLERNHHGPAILTIESSDFSVGELRWGRGLLGADTPTYSSIRDACHASISDGFHCYDEMFVWAKALMEHMPGVVDVLRGRFPLLFVDEAQDNSEAQAAILYRIFSAGNKPVLRQRFGDPNQAIFNSVRDEGATTDVFPDESIKRDLPTSHRFGQKIADFADPLGIIRYRLVGQGPKKSLASGQPEAPHTIFLFDSDRSEAVLDAYGALLIDTFSEQELLQGSFVAVGQVHRPRESDTGDKRPRHVGHYWPEYDAELTGIDPKPTCFVQYIVAGQGHAMKEGETRPAVEKIASGILRLAGMARGGATYRLGTRSHRQVMSLLEYSSAAREQYLDAVVNFAVKRNVLSKEAWDGHWREAIRSVGQAVANAPLSGDEISSFLAWKGETDSDAVSSTSSKNSDNTYRYPRDAPKVHIRVGSVHSVKGETHTAALVLETFWQDNKGRHNIELLLPWLMGTKSGAGSAKKQQISRMKLHYVAMTRPSHLLCLAMKRSSLEDEKGELDRARIGKLEQHGWRVIEI